MSEQWGLEAIQRRRLKLARFGDMNDPFELLGIDLPRRSDRNLFQKLKEEVNQTVGVLCFSRGWSNPVLWSHYADRHRGIGLGFDLLDQYVQPVTYAGKRLPAQAERNLPAGSTEALGYKLLTTKYEHWRYEDEVRLIVELKHAIKDGGRYFVPFGPALLLREVISGSRCLLPRSHMRSLVNNERPMVSTVQGRLAFRTYRVVRNKAAK
jgi:hypothetical protein